MSKGRGWLSSIDKLPEECQPIVTWASQELAKMNRSQVEVYGEFKEKLIALQGELGLDFDIPHYRTFSRFSVKVADAAKQIENAHRMTAMLADRFDAAKSDELTIVAAEMVKSLVLDIAIMSANGKATPKNTLELSGALKNLANAQVASATRRMKLEAEERVRRVEAEAKEQMAAVVDMVSNEPGISKEVLARVKRDILGVRSKPKPKAEGEAQ